MGLAAMKNRVRSVLAPPPDLSIWEWAEQHYVISTEYASQPGKFRINKTPYLKQPFEDIKHPETEEILLETAAQVAKTTLLMATWGYFMAEDPAPLLYVMPSLDAVEDFSKERIAPMIRDTKVLSELIDIKARDTSNTILNKSFANGSHAAFCGANSPTSLSSRPRRVVLVDEVSRLPQSSGSEGDPLMLAKKRTSTFYNRKLIMASTPTEMATCKTHQMMTDEVTRRHEYRVPCPHCKENIKLEWTQVIWEDEDPTTARYECQNCKKNIRDSQKMKMLRDGFWHCLNPEVGRFRMGYQLSALYSPWVTFEEMVREYLKAQRDVMRMKAFVNLYLGEPFEEETEGVEHSALFMRREHYPKGVDVPEGGLVLTAGVDTQDDRLEAEVVAWGIDEHESWSVDYLTIWGDPSEQRTWEQLTDLLDKDYIHEWGMKMRIAAMGIDSGGHHTSEVYEYVKKMRTRRVFALKGKEGEGRALVSAPSRRRSGRDRRHVDLYTVGVDGGKTTFYQKLRIADKGPGFCHFPSREEYSKEHFRSMTSERCKVVYRNGYPVKRWFLPDHLRNEPLDCRIYSMAALKILNPIWMSLEKRLLRKRDELLAELNEGYEEQPKDEEMEDTPVRRAPLRRKPQRSANHGWVNGWRR